MKTIKTYTIQEVRRLVHKNQKITLEGFDVKTNSQRYKVFFSKLPNQGLNCAKCGVIGSKMKLETNDGKTAHFNLYTKDNVLLTKDHIVPKSKGGTNTLDNYQTMCFPCNREKGNTQ